MHTQSFTAIVSYNSFWKSTWYYVRMHHACPNITFNCIKLGTETKTCHYTTLLFRFIMMFDKVLPCFCWVWVLTLVENTSYMYTSCKFIVQVIVCLLDDNLNLENATRRAYSVLVCILTYHANGPGSIPRPVVPTLLSNPWKILQSQNRVGMICTHTCRSWYVPRHVGQIPDFWVLNVQLWPFLENATSGVQNVV